MRLAEFLPRNVYPFILTFFFRVLLGKEQVYHYSNPNSLNKKNRVCTLA